MRCPFCNGSVSPKANFCSSCGQSLANVKITKFCDIYNMEVPLNCNYCKECTLVIDDGPEIETKYCKVYNLQVPKECNYCKTCTLPVEVPRENTKYCDVYNMDVPLDCNYCRECKATNTIVDKIDYRVKVKVNVKKKSSHLGLALLNLALVADMLFGGKKKK